jgi:hypothetical protein
MRPGFSCKHDWLNKYLYRIVMSEENVNKDQCKDTGVVKEPQLDIPEFKPNIPSYMLKDLKESDKFLLEQLSIMKNQNGWQTSTINKIYNYTKTINGKVVELENFRQRMLLEIDLEEKWAGREKEMNKYKKYTMIVFFIILYPLYMVFVDKVGLSSVIEKLIGAGL